MSQLAFILLLLLASVNLAASANPVCKCDNGNDSKKVVDYNIQIRESGAQYNETIEVDTEKQTELFKVPAHNNVDHSNILHDFKINLSMLLLPEKKICYLLPLDKELSAPRKLISDLDQTQKPIRRTQIIDNQWTVGREITDRSVLSDELANFCAKYPIYHFQRLEDSMQASRIQIRGRKTRAVVRPTVSYQVIPNYQLCTGGKDSPSEADIEDCVWNQRKHWKVECQITSRSCYYIDVCESVGKCLTKHLINNIHCCQYVCLA